MSQLPVDQNTSDLQTDRHIASFIVYVQPERMDSLIALLAQWPDTEISHRDASGKFVLVNETDSYDGLNRLMAHLHEQPGVLNVSLVSHFVENEASLREPMIPSVTTETSTSSQYP
ncbi:MAG TPA: chaperone NapD [Permianibacter sp.]|nr:chaperone NapD [Permianibacter sp.]